MGFPVPLGIPLPCTSLMETCISCSGRVSIYGSNCVSGITLIPRISRARDIVTMVEIGSARLTSLEIRVPDRFPGALGET